MTTKFPLKQQTPLNSRELKHVILDGFLNCLHLENKTRAAIGREMLLSDEEIDGLGIKSVPSIVHNILVSGGIQNAYGTEVLSNLKEFFWSGDLWLLNVDSRYKFDGFLLPIRNNDRGRTIKALQLYRHARDNYPYVVSNYKSQLNYKLY